MMLLNLGSRYVAGDLGKVAEAILTNEYVKKIIVFSMFFVATRDVFIAIILTIFYALLIDGIFHEKRRMCIIPQKYKDALQSQTNGKISESDYAHAKKIILEYELSKQIVRSDNQTKNESESKYANYAQSIKLLNNL